jgi:phage gp36-like protein
MAYITNADIEMRLGTRTCIGLTDDDATGSADTARVDEARSGAEAEVDCYLASRYAVPIDMGLHPELAGLLGSLALDIAEFRLHCRRPPVPEEVRVKRDLAIGLLQRVAKGEASLPVATELPGNAAQGITGQAVGRRRMLTENELASL